MDTASDCDDDPLHCALHERCDPILMTPFQPTPVRYKGTPFTHLHNGHTVDELGVLTVEGRCISSRDFAFITDMRDTPFSS